MNEAYGYQMAQNEIYIPVIDRNSEEILFTREQYDSIREKMRGLSFYRAEEFQIDQTALNSRVQSVANELRESAKGKLSTEEKREKLYNDQISKSQLHSNNRAYYRTFSDKKK